MTVGKSGLRIPGQASRKRTQTPKSLASHRRNFAKMQLKAMEANIKHVEGEISPSAYSRLKGAIAYALRDHEMQTLQEPKEEEK